MNNPLKPTGIFLCNSPETMESVYESSRMEKLRSMLRFPPEILTEKTIGDYDLSEVEAIFSTWGMFAPPEKILDSMKKLRAVFYAAGATDHFCRPFLDRGVLVVSAWRANALPVAEFAVGQILLGLKNYFAASAAYTGPERYNRNEVGCGAYGAKVALIGAGAISSRIQELLRNFDLQVLVVPSRPEHRTVSLEEAFRTAQVVSNHLPDRDDNVGVLDGRLFSSMKPRAVFLNTGRGRQVNEPELIAVLEQRPDLTALLDVTFPEPPTSGSKLYTLPNVRLTPHIAGSLNDETHRMADYVLADFERFRNGLPLLYAITEKQLLTSRK